ncbi:MAG: TolB family protein, partial [Bryobacteraceae bacterium]
MFGLFLLLGAGAALAWAQPSATMVGHEFRQDDLPAITAAPDGSVWVAWLSFGGDRDDIAIRRYADGRWNNIQWLPGSSGDNWLPQVAVDAGNRVWVVWSSMAAGNWDLFARSFDPGRQEWGAVERLTSDPMPDVNPRLATDGKGRFAVVWQGFRGRNSNIFLRMFEGGRWSPAVRVTNRTANDWEPAAAFDGAGNIWIAYDSYKSGNYDVYLTRVAGGVAGAELSVAATPRFESRATVAVDASGRVWVAYEAGMPNWGKDQGYILRDRRVGVPLGGVREPRIRCYENGAWRDLGVPLRSAFGPGNTYQPHVFTDQTGS